MSKLTTAQRNALPQSVFAGKDRSYPIPDRGHAIAAKSRASHAEKVGHISEATEERIDAKADRMLGKKSKLHGIMSVHGERGDSNA